MSSSSSVNPTENESIKTVIPNGSECTWVGFYWERNSADVTVKLDD